MAKAIRVCKVCGKRYEYCQTALKGPGLFRWQDVACCPEHASTYFARIAASRSGLPKADKPAPAPVKEPEPEQVWTEEYDEDEDENDWFEDDPDDTEDEDDPDFQDNE